jgi:hypothetical protein
VALTAYVLAANHLVLPRHSGTESGLDATRAALYWEEIASIVPHTASANSFLHPTEPTGKGDPRSPRRHS